MDKFYITEDGPLITIKQTVYPEVCIAFDCSRMIPVVVKIDIKCKDCAPDNLFSAIEEINDFLDIYLKNRSRNCSRENSSGNQDMD